jgi:glutaconate CoA-transferase subunit A
MVWYSSLDDAVALIEPGMSVALPPEYCGVAMAATRALIRRGTGDLHLIAVPQSGLQADMLIGAGLVATMEAAAVTLGEAGPAPCFTRAVTSGAIRMVDATCPAIHAGLQASEKGIPYMPLRGILETDVLANRADWQVLDNPFGHDDPVVLIPAIRPDIALFHAEMADAEGNVLVGRRRELAVMAHAAHRTIVTVEEIHDGDLFADEILAAGALSSIFVDAVVHVPGGARPLAMPGAYDLDGGEVAAYAAAAQSPDGMRDYLDRHVYDTKAPA